MPSASKPSGERDIGSFRDKLDRSRLALTLAYVAMLACALLASGAFTRQLFSRRLEHRFYAFQEELRLGPGRWVLPPRAEDVRRDLLEVGLVVDGLLLAGAGVVGYVLAGVTLRPVRAAYERQRAFLGDASHELRTPLAILQLDLENDLAAARTDADRAAAAGRLEEVRRMGRLVSDLLVLSRLDQAPTIGEPVVLDLLSVIRVCVERLEPTAAKRNVTTDVRPSGDAPVRASVPSEDLLVRAITNVVHNAIVYNTDGGRVEIDLSSEGGTARIHVRDTGIGIPAADLGNVFERFYRSEKSRSRRTGGSGLGLSIVHSAMEAMGGGVTVESEAGKGTTVVLSLPVHTAS